MLVSTETLPLNGGCVIRHLLEHVDLGHFVILDDFVKRRRVMARVAEHLFFELDLLLGLENLGAQHWLKVLVIVVLLVLGADTASGARTATSKEDAALLLGRYDRCWLLLLYFHDLVVILGSF